MHSEVTLHVSSSSPYLGYGRPLKLLFDLFRDNNVPGYSQMGQCENYVQIVWDKGEHHLHINLYAISYDWFYRNRDTLQYYGVENNALDLLDPVLKMFFVYYF